MKFLKNFIFNKNFSICINSRKLRMKFLKHGFIQFLEGIPCKGMDLSKHEGAYDIVNWPAKITAIPPLRRHNAETVASLTMNPELIRHRHIVAIISLKAGMLR